MHRNTVKGQRDILKGPDGLLGKRGRRSNIPYRQSDAGDYAVAG
jgi:hypothetical protein